MQWKANKDGDTRKSTSFAFFPISIGDNWYWLETVIVKEKYHGDYRDGFWSIVDIKPKGGR